MQKLAIKKNGLRLVGWRLNAERTRKMKKNLHPSYRYVVFQDAASDFQILTRSTAQSDQKILWTDGQEYPLVTVEVSSASHPFHTGQPRRTLKTSLWHRQ